MHYGLSNRDSHWKFSNARETFTAKQKDGMTQCTHYLVCPKIKKLLKHGDRRIVRLKVRNDHRSIFSNLSNWKEEALKKSGLQLDSTP